MTNEANEQGKVDAVDTSLAVSEGAIEEEGKKRATTPGAVPITGGSKTKKVGKRMEKNARFKDVEATGNWGNLSKMELFGVVAAIIVISMGAIFFVVFFVLRSDDDDEPALARPIPIATAAPSQRETGTPEERLKSLLSVSYGIDDVLAHLDELPDDLAFYGGKASDASQPPFVRASAWVILEDPAEEPGNSSWLVPRYALAVIYYSMGGDNWVDHTGWLEKINTCDWYGIDCDDSGEQLEQLLLPGNNLINSIPVEINLLRDVRSIRLNDNNISGELPNLALGELPVLLSLYLNHNNFQGRISKDLRANELVDTMLLHGNNFTGFFPIEFCPFPGEPVILRYFSIDCEKVGCDTSCCQNEQYELTSPCY